MWRFPSSIRRWPIIHRPGLLSLLDWPIKKSRQLPKHPCNGAGKRYILYLLGAFILFSRDGKYIVRTTNFCNLWGIKCYQKLDLENLTRKRHFLLNFQQGTFSFNLLFWNSKAQSFYKFSSAVCHFAAELQNCWTVNGSCTANPSL